MVEIKSAKEIWENQDTELFDRVCAEVMEDIEKASAHGSCETLFKLYGYIPC